MDISPPNGPWKKGPNYNPIEWTQSTIDNWSKGLLEPSNEQLQKMINLSGIEGVDFTRLKEGHSHFVFKVSGAEQENLCVLKATAEGRRNSLAGAIYWQGWLEELIQVPKILFHDLTFQAIPYAFIVFEFIDAQDLITCVDNLSDSKLDNIAAKVVEANRALLKIPPCHGFGGAKSHFDKGMYTSWGEFLQSSIEETVLPRRASPEFHKLATKCLQRLTLLEPIISQIKRVYLFLRTQPTETF